jgi:hypothetical protein
MAASTCLHPYQNTRTAASERDAFVFHAEHRRGLCSKALCLPVCVNSSAGSSERATAPVILSISLQRNAARLNCSIRQLLFEHNRTD